MKQHRVFAGSVIGLIILIVLCLLLFRTQDAPAAPVRNVERYALSERVEPAYSVNQGFERIFLYRDTLCQFRLAMQKTDFSVQLISVADGAVLQEYVSSCFPASVHPGSLFLYLDENEQLWGMGYQQETAAWVGPERCDPDALWRPAPDLEDIPANGVKSFFVLPDVIGIFVAPQNAGTLFLWDREGTLLHTLDPVLTYGLDGTGGLLYLEQVDEMGGGTVKKISLQTGALLWTLTPEQLPGACINLFCGNETAWLLCSTGISSIYSLDVQTGRIGEELLDLEVDVKLPEDTRPFSAYYSFALDRNETVAFSAIEVKDHEILRKLWIISKKTISINEADAVTLTVTMPYPVDAVRWGIQAYQREHPEVQVVWDIPYSSREEFRDNAAAYAEQITLRIMTGDVGDLQLVLGNGLRQEVVTDTDAFLDLTQELNACAELDWNLIEPLRGEDGAIRAVPLGVRPTVYIWNDTLWRREMADLDPNTVTWSQLLSLAARWEEQGMDYSLTTWDADQLESGKENLLTAIVLANLYGETKEDFGLDVPEVRSMLEQLKGLWSSTVLVRGDGNAFETGFLKHALFAPSVRTDFADVLVDLASWQEREGLGLRYASQPGGETQESRQGYGYCWAIPASSHNSEAAAELLCFLLSRDGLPGHRYSDNTMVINRLAQGDWCAEVDAQVGGTFEPVLAQLQTILAQPVIRYNEVDSWQEAVVSPVRAYLDDELPLDQAITQAKSNWERLMCG